MKIFIWKELAYISDNCHKGGGLMIVAKNIERAKEMAGKDKDIRLTYEKKIKAETYRDITPEEKEKGVYDIHMISGNRPLTFYATKTVDTPAVIETAEIEPDVIYTVTDETPENIIKFLDKGCC